MLDSYKESGDQENKYAQSAAMRKEEMTQKFFPGKDVPLGQHGQREGSINESEMYGY